MIIDVGIYHCHFPKRFSCMMHDVLVSFVVTYLPFISQLAWCEIPDPKNRSFSLGREMKQHRFCHYCSSRNHNPSFWRTYLMRVEVDCFGVTQTEDTSRVIYRIGSQRLIALAETPTSPSLRRKFPGGSPSRSFQPSISSPRSLPIILGPPVAVAVQMRVPSLTPSAAS